MYNKFKYKTKLISKYLYHLEKLRTLNKLLYNSTEFFEEKRMIDFEYEQWHYFAKNLTKFGRMINELRNKCSDDELIEINKLLTRRY